MSREFWGPDEPANHKRLSMQITVEELPKFDSKHRIICPFCQAPIPAYKRATIAALNKAAAAIREMNDASEELSND